MTQAGHMGRARRWRLAPGLFSPHGPAILDRYLIVAILRPLLAVLGTCAALFASYGAVDLMGEAANGLLASGSIAAMIGLRVLIALEMLVPIALYLSIVLAFGRLYETSEFAAIWSLRVTPWMVLRAVLVPAGACAVLVGFLSLVVRPWAYERLHELAYRSTLTLNTDALAGGTFYITQDGKRVIHLDSRMRGHGPARHIFMMQRLDDGYMRVVSAQIGYAMRNASSGTPGGPLIRLENAHVYDIAQQDGLPDRVLSLASATEDPTRHGDAMPDRNAVATPTRTLMGSTTPEDISERQWRFSTAISTLILSVLAVALGRGSPRQERFGRVGTALGVYFIYYIALTAARTSVQHGQIGAVPGIWWAPALLSVLAAWLFSRRILERR
ncbi:LPS export ABC transporter permease LptF [Acidomonas methanolica]|nr:LPS export ABC transporter permease LptF [Acidomonas methanolica]